MLQITPLFNILSWDIIAKNDLKPHNMQALYLITSWEAWLIIP